MHTILIISANSVRLQLAISYSLKCRPKTRMCQGTMGPKVKESTSGGAQVFHTKLAVAEPREAFGLRGALSIPKGREVNFGFFWFFFGFFSFFWVSHVFSFFFWYFPFILLDFPVNSHVFFTFVLFFLAVPCVSYFFGFCSFHSATFFVTPFSGLLLLHSYYYYYYYFYYYYYYYYY